MNKLKYIVSVLTLILGLNGLAFAGPQDSIGTKVKNGKIFILHKVEKSQGLFSISRRYGIALNEIITANPGSDQILHVDQVLMIPTGKDAPMEEKVVKEYFSDDKPRVQADQKNKTKKSTFARYHTVAQGETLYSISVLYQTKVDVIKNLNGLKTDVLSVGQQIMVPASRQNKVDFDKDRVVAEQKLGDTKSKSNKLRRRVESKSDTKPKVKIKPITSDAYEIKVEKMPKYNVEKISEKGTVEVYDIERDIQQGTNLRLCSHHVAQIGSTIMVTNPENQKSVFVKVAANHTLNKETGNIIQLSPTALGDIEIQEGEKVEVSFAR